MKYIRIEDKIYAFTDLPYDSDSNGNNSYENNKLANTIEELCDCFIGVPDREWFKRNLIAINGVNFFQKPFHLEYKYFDKKFNGLKLKNQNGWEFTAQEWQDEEHNFIMGCIETDKGLIYVAKMNNEGELELL